MQRMAWIEQSSKIVEKLLQDVDVYVTVTLLAVATRKDPPVMDVFGSPYAGYCLAKRFTVHG